MVCFYFFAEAPWSPYIAFAVLAGALVVSRIIKGSRGNLDHIAKLEFQDGDKSTDRYIRDTGALLHEGYLKVGALFVLV
jgi:hypothetical protein